MSKIENLKLENKFSTLSPDFYTKLEVTPFDTPFMVSFNSDVSKLIGVSENEPDLADYLCGKKKFKNADYLASVYAGHQFGTFVPQLGDGRAILVGEVNGWEIQFKGSGKTPYSRFGDGRAVLRSCIREYLCSEAMHNLGIPTTRALCVVGSDEEVIRESVEKGAMLTRLAPSHIRFGHFEYFYYSGKHDKVRELADFVIEHYYPNHSYEEFFEEVVLRTASLMAKWQAVGWAHGVMNTDNMSILGITIDYGPFGFVDNYHADFIPNHSDHTGRYALDQQPSIGLWNLYALAQSLEPLIPVAQSAKILEKYQPKLIAEYAKLMRAKLGFFTEDEEDLYLVRDILDLLEKNSVDYTIFFRKLSQNENLRGLFLDREVFDSWNNRYKARILKEEAKGRVEAMSSVNPRYILRNYLAEQAIREATLGGGYAEVSKLLNLLKKPFDEQPQNEIYAKEPPDWAKYLEVSCSS